MKHNLRFKKWLLEKVNVRIESSKRAMIGLKGE